MTETDINASEVIASLGGNAKTAALCEVTPSAVSQWIKNGIPRAQLKYLRVVRPEVFNGGGPLRRRRTDQ